MIIQIGESEKFIDCYEAVTPEEQAQGLSKASHLDPGTGLLFFYEEETALSFWMPPQMRFAIDIAFINASGKVVEVFENCQPGETDPEKPGSFMKFEGTAKWVLEVSTGECERFGIRPGVQIHFDDDDDAGLV